MSHIVPIEKINQFLPIEKLELDTTLEAETEFPVDHYKISDLEETARDNVFARLATVYDVDGWSSPNQRPSLVTNILGLLIAGWVYDRQFSEESTSAGGYGQRRVREAWALVDELLAGTLIIEEDRLDIDDLGEASVLETEPVFTMGEQF
jgi:hypothetical protein